MHVDVRRCFEEQRAHVYRWAFALCRRHDDALDTVQDVFLRMVRRPPTAAATPELRAWLRRATRSAVVDRWRRDQARPRLVDDAGMEIAASASRPLPADETAERIRATLSTLSEQQQLVILAKICDGLTFRETAAELGIAESTAKTHYLRGLAALRDKLAVRPTIGSIT